MAKLLPRIKQGKNVGESSYESQTKEIQSNKKIEEREIKFSKTPDKRNESSSFSKKFS
jgi:hypothetical protein